MTSRLGIAITLVAAALLVTSSAGVSTVALERSVEIEVVDDERAMVGFETEAANESENGSTVGSLEVSNRAGTDLNPTVDIESDGNGDVDVDAPDVVATGESETISVTGECTDDVELDVTLVGEGIRIERTATLDCEA